MNDDAKKEIETKGKVLRCPNCGASDASYDMEAGGLRCLSCRTVFVSPKINQFGGIEELVGEVKSEGAKDVETDDFVMTLRCPSCGANVMLSKEDENASCHWCRHNLKTAERVPNGSMPDLVLPFKLKRKTALTKMKDFVRKRRFFSLDGFANDLSEETIRGVYLPYVVVDVNAKVSMKGSAEKSDGISFVSEAYGDESHIKKVYDVSTFDVERDFDLRIDDLTIEASRDKFEYGSLINTTHIINAIMPFDTEEAVEWDSRYLKGYSSERRDLNVDQLKSRLDNQVNDIARYRMMETTLTYDRGVRWDHVDIKKNGVKWKTAYFPVWIYSHAEKGIGGKRAIHYIAVNARTGEVMGSIPLHSWLRTFLVAIPMTATITFAIFIAMTGFNRDTLKHIGILLVLTIITLLTMKIVKSRSKEYTNKHARHMYELDTFMTVNNLKKRDIFRSSIIRENKRMIPGYNEERMTGAHDFLMEDDSLEEATGVKTVAFIKIFSYFIIGIILFLVLGALFLLIGSVIDFTS